MQERGESLDDRMAEIAQQELMEYLRPPIDS